MPCVVVSVSDNEVATRVDCFLLTVCKITFEPKKSFVGRRTRFCNLQSRVE